MSICSLLKKKRKESPLLIHSNFEVFILHTYIYVFFCELYICKSLTKNTHKKKELWNTRGGGGGEEERKEKVKNKSSEVIGLHATEVKK